MIVGPDGINVGRTTSSPSEDVVVSREELASLAGAGTPDTASRIFAVTGIVAGTTQTQAGATALTGDYNNVITVGTAGDGVKLMAATLGQVQTVKNSGANALAVYPATGDSINALAANLAVFLAPGATLTFNAISATVWESSGDVTLTLNSPTTLSGRLTLEAADNAGNYEVRIKNASHAAARTYTVPDCAAAANFVMTEAAQNVNGAKTFGIAIKCTANVGTANAGTTAVEYGDGYNHVTVLTVSTTLPAIAGGANLAVGKLLYTLPAGVQIIDAAYMTLGITQTQGNINADTPDGGLGTVIGSGVVATLDGTPTFEDILTGQTFNNCTGTAEVKTATPTAGVPLVRESGDAKTIHFNVADGWAASGDAAALLAGTVVLTWRTLA